MATDIRKLKDKAQALIIKGKYAKALQLYQQIVEIEPKDIKIWVKIGDLYRKLKRPDQAIEIYAKASRSFAVNGFLMQAISVSKMILEIDPQQKETQEALAELYAKKEGESIDHEGAARAVPAASMAILEKLKKKAPPVRTPAVEIQKAPATPEPEPEIEEIQPEPVLEPVVEEAVEQIDEIEIELEEPEIELDTAEEVTEQAVEDDQHGVPNFDGLDLDEADGLFDSIMSMDEVDLQTEVHGIADLKLPNIPLFSSLTPEEFSAILEQLELRRFDINDRIIREGEMGDSFYIIARGSADVVKKAPDGKEIKVATVAEGSFFGEFAFFNDSERHASVIVRQEMDALEIGRSELEELTRRYPRMKEVLRDFYRQRLLGSLLAISPLFQPFSDDEKKELLEQFIPEKYELGDIIIKQGQEGDGLYLILNGEVIVNVKAPEGGVHEVARLSEGAFFGEISLIQDTTTTANCIAADDIDVYKLSRKSFKELIMMQPRLLEVVAEFSEKRSQQTKRVVAGGDTALAEAGMV